MRICSLLLYTTFLVSSITSSYAEISTHKLIRQDNSELIYYLDKQAEHNKTLLVLMQGSDCNSIKNNTFIQETFGRWLPSSDVLMVEKYGITAQLTYSDDNGEREDCPKNYKLHDNPNQRLADYLAVLDKLSPNYTNIVLLGGSEGATMVHLVVAERHDISAAIALNGGGRFFLDDVLYNIRNTTPKEHVEEAINSFQQLANAIITNQIGDEQFVSEHSKLWWQQYLAIDLLEVVKRNTQTPVLIVQTLDDINVDVAAFHQLSQEITQPNVTFIKYDKLNHGFYNQQGERLTGKVVQDIQQWYAQYNK
ncbi:alpha/beta hydrolase family protein [Proteus mirabilis]|uniref:alpha/beta hydrolase family protein n=1 Tax=Proteus TaxID=583 RepID=UPI0013781289|nr:MULTISPECIES: acyl-CoA thioester hydrolase/BAAT C-terminal domain-containing protein [Proteus]MBG5942168.1 alpha/beta hydrolase [Proteus mirabilis]MDC9734153.1 acyl-CoA thioester hydrolase/BAAT C-terminal domain-containing protein [Proteus mirabilis]MDC9773177.1 acyl-CoA thioester hydrolase/BAAT C-terminal domain-containing protein [Proteus mirabilis]MDC9780191.1 acyl-CoA thioester hydrolase/BAAT C-terminal domain-containing protein [Proteus mirabilis]NBN51341.1 alpha/beta hydrolase [Proteu